MICLPSRMTILFAISTQCNVCYVVLCTTGPNRSVPNSPRPPRQYHSQTVSADLCLSQLSKHWHAEILFRVAYLHDAGECIKQGFSQSLCVIQRFLEFRKIRFVFRVWQLWVTTIKSISVDKPLQHGRFGDIQIELPASLPRKVSWKKFVC